MAVRLAWLAVVLAGIGAAGALVLGLGGSEDRAGLAPPPSPVASPSPLRLPTPTATPREPGEVAPPGRADPPIAWRSSRALGLPHAGRLQRGVQLPAEGRDFFTWDPIVKSAPNRGWRRWGTDRLVRLLLATLRDYRRANPDAPRVGIGDLSRPHGGDFGRRFGGLGHASHQNGLDADLYYPRRDRRERRPHRPGLVDRVLAQRLVDAFTRAGAQLVFVGPRLGLTGPRRTVQPLAHHDDHLHVRIR